MDNEAICRIWWLMMTTMIFNTPLPARSFQSVALYSSGRRLIRILGSVLYGSSSNRASKSLLGILGTVFYGSSSNGALKSFLRILGTVLDWSSDPTRQSFKKFCLFIYVHLVVPSPLCNYSYAGVSFKQEIQCHEKISEFLVTLKLKLYIKGKVKRIEIKQQQNVM